MKNYDTIIFDLFFTLVEPKYSLKLNEFDILEISKEEWESHSEGNDLYLKRISGKNMSKKKIITDILDSLAIDYDDTLVNKVLNVRAQRFGHALKNVPVDIIDVLKELKNRNKKLVLLSNADVIDIACWTGSPLYSLIEKAFFSCEIKMVKPDIKSYQYVLKKMNKTNETCLYIGDGGDNELFGASQAQLDTVLASHLYKRTELDNIADITYEISNINELLSIIV